MKAITVNYSNKEIVISSAFAKKCFNPGTHEYDQLQAVRRDFPDFSLETKQFQKNTKQEHFKGLNYDYMRYYIGKVERCNAPAVLEELEDLIDIGKCHSLSKRYPVVKSWFLARYPEVAIHGLSKEEIAEAAEKAELRKIEAAEKAAKAKAAKEKEKWIAENIHHIPSAELNAEEDAA